MMRPIGIILAIIAASLTASASAQQQSDIDAVKAAIVAYHAAVGPLSGSKMDPLWAHDATVILLNPRDKKISVGWDAVKKNWEDAGNFWSELKVTQADGPYIQVKGDVAWSMGIANAVGKSKAGAAINAPTAETDVFEKAAGSGCWCPTPPGGCLSRQAK